MRYFHDDADRGTRGLQLYLILIGRAANRQTITYKQLAAHVGWFKPDGTLSAGVVGGKLDPLQRWCEQNGLPILSCLVVNGETGWSEWGMIPHNDQEAEREKVFRFQWHAIFPPMPEELEEACRGA